MLCRRDQEHLFCAVFDPSLKLCDPGACSVWVCSPSGHRMEYERERERKEDRHQ